MAAPPPPPPPGPGYSSADATAESAERLAKKLTADIRQRLRKFQHHPPFSQGWMDTIENIKYLAAVAASEAGDVSAPTATGGPTAGGKPATGSQVAAALTHAPPSAGGTMVSGYSGVRATEMVGHASSGTVWERDEVTVRTIVEEGKINLLTRSMVEYKATVLSSGYPSPDFEPYGRVYEQSLGVLLRCAFRAVECMQTLDVRNLLEHCSLVMHHALRPDAPPLVVTGTDAQLQEVLVISYLVSFAEHLEKLQNQELVTDKFCELGILELAWRHFDRFHSQLDPAKEVPMYFFFFASFADTEFFKTKLGYFFPDKDKKAAFVASFDAPLKAYAAGGGDKKKRVRPLSDLILRFKC